MFCDKCGRNLESSNVCPVCDVTVGAQRCPFCREEIILGAAKCKHCGEFLRSELRTPRQVNETVQRSWNPGAAAVMSFLIPGLGQIYEGHILAGLVWLCAVVAGYLLFILPGIALHIVCIANAYSATK